MIDEKSKLTIVIVPTTLVIGLITALILYLCLPADIKKMWSVSLILGVLTACMNFGIIIKGNRKLERMATDETTVAHPKKTNALFLFLRFLVLVAVFGTIALDQFTATEPRFNVIPALIGYSILKIIMIIYILVRRGKVNS